MRPHSHLDTRVHRSLFLFMMAAGAVAACFAAPMPMALNVSVDDLRSPAGAGAMGSSLTTSSAGATWLSWIEPDGENQHALKFARFDVANRRWSEPRLVASGADWFVNWADFPVLAARDDRLLAVWFVNPPDGDGRHAGYHAEFAVSHDAGTTWSRPQPLAPDSRSVEFVALQVLPPASVLAAWLDGRQRSGAGAHDRQSLYARVVGGPQPDFLVDPSVCDCCQLSMIPTPDGGALLAYRGRSADEIRDIRFARFRAGRWEKPQTLHADNWKITGCPVNGPQLATNGRQVVATWFTAANGRPRVYLARANDGLARFSEPTAIDLGRPLGRVDCVVLADGTALVTWLENSGAEKEGGIFMRAVSPTGGLSAPVLLASTTTARASGFPRLTLLSDESPARMLLSYTRDGAPSAVVTALVTVETRSVAPNILPPVGPPAGAAPPR